MTGLFILIGLLMAIVIDRLADLLPRAGVAAGTRPAPVARSRIVRRPWVYPVVVLLYTALYWRVGLSLQFLILALYVSILILIAVIDLEHRRVLNAIVAPALLVALLMSNLSATTSLGSALTGGILGFGAFLFIALISPGGMGMGDVKLAGLIGVMLGFPLVIVALLVGMVSGGVIAGGLLLARVVDRRSYMPYAPALVLGSLAAMLYGVQILQWYTR
jgi:leader peptidase (prepilin peptidase) / N-methyltransferase